MITTIAAAVAMFAGTNIDDIVVLTVLFAAAYLALYPGLGSFAGTLGWSSTRQHSDEIAKADQAMQSVYAQFQGKPVEALAKDPQAMGIGERLFANNCATCHGADAKGSKGFPNLTDNDWLHGGQYDTIIQTIISFQKMRQTH